MSREINFQWTEVCATAFALLVLAQVLPQIQGQENMTNLTKLMAH